MRKLSRHRVGRFLLRLVVSTFIVSAFFVLWQDFLIFPGLYSSQFFNKKNWAPSAVDVLTTNSADGHTVTVWRARAEQEKAVALLFHGNADSVSSFVGVQGWLQSLGISSYSMEYRGYGGWGSGWPSEEKFQHDAGAAYALLRKEESIDPRKIIVIGSSIGTGIAAYTAHAYQVGVLVLLSPYTSLRNVVAEMPVVGALSPFLRYDFPTQDFLSKINDACLIIAHGRRDSTIPFSHSEKLSSLYSGRGRMLFLPSSEAGHNDLLARVNPELAQAMLRCLPDDASQGPRSSE